MPRDISQYINVTFFKNPSAPLMEEYYGEKFTESKTTSCSVARCWFVHFNDRALTINTENNIECSILGCLFIDVGITNSSEDGGEIFFYSRGSRINVVESFFKGSPIVKYGIFLMLRCKKLLASFLEMGMSSKKGSGHMALNCHSDEGCLKYINYSKIYPISSINNAGLQFEEGLYTAKFIQSINCQGYVMFRVGSANHPDLSYFIFANCNASNGVISLIYGEITISDTVFSKIEGQVFDPNFMTEGYDCYLIKLINPVFYGFESIQSHPSLIIQSL